MKRTQNPLNKVRAAGAATVPGVKEQKDMKRKFGFTLVELLVVIAIISILAAIVTPRVQGYILRGRMTKAVSEVHGIELAMAKVLTDAGKDNFRQLFVADDDNDPDTHYALMDPPTDDTELQAQIEAHSNAFYQILRQGRNADLTVSGLVFAPGVQEKLGTSYVDLNRDPWDHLYQFWMGPWKGYVATPLAPIPLRIYRAGVENDDGTYTVYNYNEHKAELDDEVPGNPPLEASVLPGIPAPKDMSIYVFSTGVNAKPDQFFNNAQTEDNYKGGGDDINNWDKQQGWTSFYS